MDDIDLNSVNPFSNGFQKWVRLSIDELPLIRPPKRHLLANVTGGLKELYSDIQKKEESRKIKGIKQEKQKDSINNLSSNLCFKSLDDSIKQEDSKNALPFGTKLSMEGKVFKNLTDEQKSETDIDEYNKRNDESGWHDSAMDINEETSPYTDHQGAFVPEIGMPLLASRYKYVKTLASGQSALIIEAHDTFAKDKSVAIKVLHQDFKPIGSQEADILLEVHRADPWLHVPFARLQNQFIYGPHYCLVFDFLSPTPLNTHYQQHNIRGLSSIPYVKNLCVKLLTVLGFFHKQNVIHADLKPENILLSDEEDMSSIMVIDFGNALRNTEEELSLYYTDFELQTLLYRAPEVFFGLKFSLEIDMWSLGCMLAECYIGEPLFMGITKEDILTKITKLLGPFPKEFATGECASLFSHFIGRPLTRYQRLENLRKKLNSCQDINFLLLLESLLTYLPEERITPFQAACHPFVASVNPFLYLMPTHDHKKYPTVVLDSTIYPFLPSPPKEDGKGLVSASRNRLFSYSQKFHSPQLIKVEPKPITEQNHLLPIAKSQKELQFSKEPPQPQIKPSQQPIKSIQVSQPPVKTNQVAPPPVKGGQISQPGTKIIPSTQPPPKIQQHQMKNISQPKISPSSSQLKPIPVSQPQIKSIQLSHVSSKPKQTSQILSKPIGQGQTKQTAAPQQLHKAPVTLKPAQNTPQLTMKPNQIQSPQQLKSKRHPLPVKPKASLPQSQTQSLQPPLSTKSGQLTSKPSQPTTNKQSVTKPVPQISPIPRLSPAPESPHPPSPEEVLPDQSCESSPPQLNKKDVSEMPNKALSTGTQSPTHDLEPRTSSPIVPSEQELNQPISPTFSQASIPTPSPTSTTSISPTPPTSQSLVQSQPPGSQKKILQTPKGKGESQHKQNQDFSRTDVKQTLKSMGLRTEDFTISVYSREQAHAILRKQGVEVTNHSSNKPTPVPKVQRQKSNPTSNSSDGVSKSEPVRPPPPPQPTPPAKPSQSKDPPPSQDDDDDDDDCIILDPPPDAPRPPPPQPKRLPQRFQLMGTTVQVNRGSKRALRGMSHAPVPKRPHARPPQYYYNEGFSMEENPESSVQDTLKRLKNYNISITCRRNSTPKHRMHQGDSDSDMEHDGAMDSDDEDMAKYLECQLSERGQMEEEEMEAEGSLIDLNSSNSNKVDDEEKDFNSSVVEEMSKSKDEESENEQIAESHNQAEQSDSKTSCEINAKPTSDILHSENDNENDFREIPSEGHPESNDPPDKNPAEMDVHYPRCGENFPENTTQDTQKGDDDEINEELEKLLDSENLDEEDDEDLDEEALDL